MLREQAFAKVNLCLHVTGQRPDGLHLLDSLVVFPQVGDLLEASAAPALMLDIDGPFAAALSGENLVLQAARMLGQGGAHIRLHKNLPVASGIGGGSADAAATLRVLSRLWGVDLPETDALAALGADIPVCMAQTPTRMQGIGEILSPLPPLPDFWILLVNSGEGVNTGAVFGAMENRNNAPIPRIPQSFQDAKALFAYLAGLRNDMQDAACKISPVIAEVLERIANTADCALARMSGSGGTCFGLYPDRETAENAAATIRKDRPDWWVAAAPV